MAKHFVRPPATISIPPGADDTYELADPNDRERFFLDVWRGTLRLSKLRFQNRVRIAIDHFGKTYTVDGTDEAFALARHDARTLQE